MGMVSSCWHSDHRLQCHAYNSLNAENTHASKHIQTQYQNSGFVPSLTVGFIVPYPQGERMTQLSQVPKVPLYFWHSQIMCDLLYQNALRVQTLNTGGPPVIAQCHVSPHSF